MSGEQLNVIPMLTVCYAFLLDIKSQFIYKSLWIFFTLPCFNIPGSFLNTTLNSCTICKKGTYQPSAQQTSCIPCPPNTSTKGIGAVSIFFFYHLFYQWYICWKSCVFLVYTKELLQRSFNFGSLRNLN